MAKKKLSSESPLPPAPKLTREKRKELEYQALAVLKPAIFQAADNAFNKAFKTAGLAKKIEEIETWELQYLEAELLNFRLFNLRILRTQYLEDLLQRNEEYSAAKSRLKAIKDFAQNGCWRDGVKVRSVPLAHPVWVEIKALEDRINAAEWAALETIDLECDRVMAAIKAAGLEAYDLDGYRRAERLARINNNKSGFKLDQGAPLENKE